MSNLAQAVQSVLDTRAVQFGDPRVALREKAYAQALSFIPYPWVEQTGDGVTSPTQTQATGPDGIALPLAAGGEIDFQVPVGTAGAFHMLYLKLHVRNAYNVGDGSAIGSKDLITGAVNSMQNGRSFFDATFNQHLFFQKFCAISVFVNSGGGRGLLGALQRKADQSGFEEVPVCLGAYQDWRDGLVTVRIPYQIPAGGTIKVRVKSLGTAFVYNLYVNGAIMGYRIML